MSYPEVCQREPVPENFDPSRWLASHAQRDMVWMLAHAEDGVIWGKVENGQLTLAGQHFSEVSEVNVALDGRTLQQARLFGPAGEVFLWRTPEGKFLARRIADGPTPSADTLEDRQWLWGTKGAKGREAGGFTLLVEGKQGLRHAPPITGLGAETRVMLAVRHYLATDDKTGLAYIADSRLTDLRRAEN